MRRTMQASVAVSTTAKLTRLKIGLLAAAVCTTALCVGAGAASADSHGIGPVRGLFYYSPFDLDQARFRAVAAASVRYPATAAIASETRTHECSIGSRAVRQPRAVPGDRLEPRPAPPRAPRVNNNTTGLRPPRIDRPAASRSAGRARLLCKGDDRAAGPPSGAV